MLRSDAGGASGRIWATWLDITSLRKRGFDFGSFWSWVVCIFIWSTCVWWLSGSLKSLSPRRRHHSLENIIPNYIHNHQHDFSPLCDGCLSLLPYPTQAWHQACVFSQQLSAPSCPSMANTRDPAQRAFKDTAWHHWITGLLSSISGAFLSPCGCKMQIHQYDIFITGGFITEHFHIVFLYCHVKFMGLLMWLFFWIKLFFHFKLFFSFAISLIARRKVRMSTTCRHILSFTLNATLFFSHEHQSLLIGYTFNTDILISCHCNQSKVELKIMFSV